MTSKTLIQRAERVMRFLMGLRYAEVRGPVEPFGLTEDVYWEGWRLLQGAAGRRLVASMVGEPDPGALQALDAWENRWYPIASAALTRHHPGAHEAVFRNLPQTTGAELVVTVTQLVERLAELEEPVKQTLRQRGLTDAVLDEARELLNRAMAFVPAPAVDPEAERAEMDAAEQAMWAWYLEWSEIARAVIKNGKVLQRLGYNPGGRRPGGTEPSDASEADVAEEPAELTDVPA